MFLVFDQKACELRSALRPRFKPLLASSQDV
jgi:hypothetical protein